MAGPNGISSYLRNIGRMNRNCKLLFLGSTISGVSQGIFMVVFNLYILSLGIPADVLGGILSAGPFAQALGSIPMGFLMETIGFKKVFLIIYGVNGLARLLQVGSTVVPLIAAAAFLGGLALAGDFVVRLPFLAANSNKDLHNQIYSFSSVLYSISMSVGALFAGFVPSLVQAVFKLNLTTAYWWILFFAGILALSAVIPFWWVVDSPRAHARKISLAPYLWGIDRFTVQQGVVSLFIGLSLGLTSPFWNIYFLYHLGTTREFFGTVSALAIIPGLIGTALAPLLVVYTGSVRIVTYLRSIIPPFLASLALTTSPWLGTIGYWGANSLNTMAQPLSFAFAMRAAKPRAKSAASAWLNVTFWFGNAAAAPLAGAFIAGENYRAPLFIAAGAILAGGLLNEIFFNPVEVSLKKEEAESGVLKVDAG